MLWIFLMKDMIYIWVFIEEVTWALKEYISLKVMYSISAAYDLGGVVTNSRRDGEITTTGKPKRPGTLKEMHW